MEQVDKLHSITACHQDSACGIDGSFMCQNGQSREDIVDETQESSAISLSTNQMVPSVTRN
jgi:hypothetical protein